MADEWIKVRVNLPTDPAVIALSNALNITPDEVVGKLIRVWAWADQQLRSCCAAGVTLSFVDDLVGLKNFGESMVSVGWLSQKKGGIEFPNYDQHISKSAKNRGLALKRMQRSRDDNVTLPAQQKRNQNKKENKKSGTGVPVPSRTPKKRAPDVVWDAVVAEFWPTLDTTKIPKPTRSRIANVVSQLKVFTDCVPDEIQARRRRMVAEFGAKGDTPESLAKHWAKYAPDDEPGWRPS